MKTIADRHHKGGVGKTATVHALGAALAGMGLRLMVDADPQSSLTAAGTGGRRPVNLSAKCYMPVPG